MSDNTVGYPKPYGFETSPTPLNFVKSVIRRALSQAHLNVRRQVTPGISAFGFNWFRDSRRGVPKFRSLYALDCTVGLKPRTVLDVGSGGGYHASTFSKSGSQVLCVDYGTSVYAQQTKVKNLDVIHVDFNHFVPPHKFQLVWASHILEHQRNVGVFIEKLIECCAEDGNVCITVPDPHRTLWGGHLTLWSPGLLAYNIVLCGVDLSDAVLVRGTNEFSIVFKPRQIALPMLTYDNGDLTMLKQFMPLTCGEDTDPWIEW